MNDTIITVTGLGKRYRIGRQPTERYTSLRETLSRKVKNAFRRRPNAKSTTAEIFWALRDVSFDVKRGEVLGIIGRNGAGKSTLLKILSRITEPTEGRIQLRGRPASLLEVGTGFHPELTGRENIYLNGAILGMSRLEIRRRFDEIVAFAGVETFLDTPVKKYSSGMYVRLAFAVAAHLEPEILIVDEVLAVGDAEFQKKCLGRMQEVSAGGRTVLLVSHNLDVIARTCSRAALMANGTIQNIGNCASIIAAYQDSGSERLQQRSISLGEANISTSVTLSEESPSRDGRSFSLFFETDQKIHIKELALIFSTPNGQRVGIIDFRGSIPGSVIQRNIEHHFSIEIFNFDLVSGPYELRLWIDGPCGSTNIEFGQTLITGTASTYLTQYPDQMNGITKFRGSVECLIGQQVYR